METANMLEKHGVEVTRILVGPSGIVSVEEVRKSIKPNTFMVSIMTVNNEIGTVQPIREIAKAIRWARTNVTKTQYPLFHTDAAQAALYENLNVEQLGVDLMTLDGTKVYGPRGMGALFVRRGTPIEQIIYGGGQERGLRSGTENIPAAKGFAKALELAATVREKESTRILELRNLFVEGLKMIRSDFKIHAGLTLHMSPHILNVTIPGIDSRLDQEFMPARCRRVLCFEGDRG
jgi:cysteine desulfurase